MQINLSMNISMRAWMKDPTIRWNAGLARAGMAFHNQLSRTHYPPIPAGSTYTRTFTTAKKANFRITEPGHVMEFGSTYYLPYLLMPARTVAHWGSKKDEIKKAMEKGFREGVKDFTSGNMSEGGE
jgi:hypothetical protein